ncbi:LysR family transcriptional regulator [Roseovarius sp. SYSU LYC5161]|uniref:LysR family transcriptional regulator n=1 Tax=Roseovarius halophilus (ex Wu et al. 2025) TaxID=3376060 RepID=UPI0039999363
MSNYRRKLPPLDALLYLECVGRHQGFTAAARELNVSQAAVSKRVRGLEDWLGVKLVARDGRGIRTTPEGDRLVSRVGLGFDFIAQTIADLRSPARPAVRLACMNALALFWLQPRLRQFALGDRGGDVALTLTDSPAELLTDPHDLVLIYGDGRFPGWRATPILTEDLQPVCAPALRDGLGAGTDVTALRGQVPLLDFPRSGPDWIGWDRWSRLPGATDISDWPRTGCATYAHAIGLALRGQGIALGSFPMLCDEIRSGRLRPLAPGPLATGRGYWLLEREDTRLGTQAANLRAFLFDEAGGPV